MVSGEVITPVKKLAQLTAAHRRLIRTGNPFADQATGPTTENS
jgi:hypothetical protein